ncbi:ABC transporter substrate-binding protein [Paenibacillus eucommiae]|uniref:Aldouronate transport system substrate-binding protein n=1 Tax=Paenibacillus eucommiae TaxID=1355755 RepID=A0ABS4J1S9_9BACL|nr:ABC transporter substrate-binding protein [Paenibacillus eucommiae]MBP1993803.1 putative aldouronate transport system substrate-binding protein [Paenibacillus eucommiae]
MKRSRIRSRIIWAMVLVVLMMTASACASKEEKAAETTKPTAAATTPGEEQKEPALEPVELTWYFPSGLQNIKDVQAVEDEMNKIVQPQINATIRLKPVDWGAFEQKVNTMNAAGESYDMVFTAPWSNNYFQNVAKGSLKPLDDLLDQYAPKLKASVPAKVWDATRVGGKIYGSINYQVVAMPFGASIDQRFIDKYKVDVSAITKYEDFEPYLAQWKEAFPPFYAVKGSSDGFTNQPPYFGMDSIGDDSLVGWVKLDDSELKVINQYASPEFKSFMELKRKWNKAGYFSKDLMDAAQVDAIAKNNKDVYTPFSIATALKPGNAAEVKEKYKADVVDKPLSKAIVTTARAIATMTGISETSKNPERAMMFLELINSDKALYNLMSHGIEGKHYKITDADKGVIESIVDSGYQPSSDWMFGNQFNGYYVSPSQVGVWEETIELNNTADASPLIGFSFDGEAVKTEITATASVWKQYADIFANGLDDTDKVLPEFLEKMNKAGAEKIIAEKQRQIDEWKKTR